MKPKAALKSAKTKVLAMASRPLASCHPASLASAALRACGLSFAAMADPRGFALSRSRAMAEGKGRVRNLRDCGGFKMREGSDPGRHALAVAMPQTYFFKC